MMKQPGEIVNFPSVPAMQDYRVELDIYHGPLDLLLYLIKRDEIDIEDIPVAHITEQYLKHLNTLKTLDINLAAEFLVMAATLMEIKSAMIAPRPEGEPGDDPSAAVDDPTDPRYELIHQLLAYKRFKDAANQLDERREDFEARFPRNPAPLKIEDDRIPELDMEDVQIWDIVEAFNRVMESIGKGPATHDVIIDDTPLELHMADLADRLKREGNMSIRAIFEGRRRGEMVGLFLATLELVRQRRLVVVQPNDDPAEIEMRLRSDEEVAKILEREDEASAKRVPADTANADDFEWPDDQEKRRYARRQEMRARGERVEEDEELEQELRELEAEDERLPGDLDEHDEADGESIEVSPEVDESDEIDSNRA